MKIWSDSFKPGEKIPSEFAFGKYHPETKCELCENRNPHLGWSDLPEGTKSLVLICHDDKVPSKPDDVNQDGRTVPASLPRVDFFHWVLVDIDPSAQSISPGEFSNEITPKGKPGPEGPKGTRQGLNNYTQWFEGDASMAGNYFGYDGPCPPWNDEIIHHYHFTLYATDLSQVAVDGSFTGPDVLKAIDGHILGKARITGKYSIYPDAKEAG